MPIAISDDHLTLAETASDMLESREARAANRALLEAPEETLPDFWSEMAELGWLGLQIPDEYDGLGLGFFDLCIVLEQSGRELMPEPFVSTLLLGTQTLLLGGTDAQNQTLLPGVALGETLLALGYEEAGSCGSAAVPWTARVRDGRGILHADGRDRRRDQGPGC